MYLKSLHIKNFRGIKETTIQWHKGVNVLVGENNAGKTAVLDALRLCLAFGDSQRDIWVRREDYHSSADGVIADVIQFDLSWADPTDEEKGVFVDLLTLPANGEAELRFHVRFEYDQERDRPKRPVYWGGELEGQPISPEVLELFEHVYLGALRDATRDLAPGRGNELSRLFLKLASKEKGREKLAKEINDQIRAIPRWRRFLDRGKIRINSHLTEISFHDSPQIVEIDFVESQFSRIVEGLRLQVPGPAIAADVPSFFNIGQNGLGYNNLIYAATVFGDLLKRRERSRFASISLIIEEPEAHLHPQLQNVIFAYLEKIASREIQVFVSSHSPTITAKTVLDSVIVLRSDKGQVTSTPVSGIELTDHHKHLLQRFLDVTKCQLFFAKSVVLVEGISEALLLPCFAKALGADYELDRCGVEVVNIGGVAFEPFVRLFNSVTIDRRLEVRCAVITDDDRCDTSGNGSGEISSRAAKAKALEGGLLKVALARNNFEYELYMSNKDLVKATYQELHPQTDLAFSGTPEEIAVQFADKVSARRDKAVFAQLLAAKIRKGQPLELNVPEYIRDAIRWAVKGDWQESDGSGT